MAETLPPLKSDPLSTPSEPSPTYEFGETEVLPAYTLNHPSNPNPNRRAQRASHEFIKTNQKGVKWATLRITSSAPSAESQPLFIGGEAIDGRLDVDLSEEVSVTRIEMTVTGKITAGRARDEQLVFLEDRKTLWTSSDPSTGAAKAGPFSIPILYNFPPEVDVSLGNEKGRYQLPTTFLERHARVSVQYVLNFTFCRTGFLRHNTELETKFAYISCVKPELPSLLRQSAYEENAPLVGPSGDPEGWKTLEKISISGTLFGKSKPVEAKATLSFAKPLCYTKGSVIPLHLLLESPSQPELDLFSAANAIDVSLRRALKYSSAKLAQKGTAPSWKDTVADVAKAVWWVNSSDKGKEGMREVWGEIQLPVDVRVSTLVATFCLEYEIVLDQFAATAYESSEKGPLVVEPVEIVSSFANGPRPRSYAPVKMDTAAKPYSDGYYALECFNVHQ